MNQNCFTKYVKETHYQNLLPEEDTHDIADSPSLKPVTVRLTPDMLETLDNLASKLSISRQKLLFEMLDGGISACIDAIAAVEADCRADRPTDDEEAFKDFYQEIRTDLIRELVA